MAQPDGPDPDPPGRPPHTGRSRLIRFVLAGIGVALVSVVPNPPRSPLDGMVLGVGALVVALVTVNELDSLVTWLATWRGRFSRPRPRTVAVAATTLLLAVAVGFGGQWVRDQGERIWIGLSGCPQPTELRLLSSPDGLAPARTLAEQYEHWTADRNHGCPAVSVYTFTASTSAIREALKDNWSAEHLRDVGPQPDLWLADSGSEVDKVKAASKDGTPIAADYPVASSPLVLGIIGTDTADAEQHRDRDMTWAQWLRQDRLQERGLVRPDPTTSPTGEVATAVLYGIGTSQMTEFQARALEQRISRSLDRDDYPLGDELAVLCRHRTLPAPRSAVIVSEQALVRFNTGAPLGSRCPIKEDPRPSDLELRAYYPSDTPSLDYRFVRFGWGYAAQEREADAFGKWLSSEEGKRALLEQGLRPPGFIPSEPLSELNGVLPGAAAFDGAPLGPVTLRSAVQLYDQANRSGRVLLALDASSSMNTSTGPGGSRFEAAAQGVAGALELMGEQDEFGLSFFPGGNPVPVGRRDEPVGGPARREAVAAALEQTVPGGNASLFRTISDGVSAVGRSDDTQVGALVVLTDGVEAGSGITLDELRRDARASGVRIFVLAVGETRCAALGVQALALETGGACYDGDAASVKVQLVEVFRALWKGR